MENEATVAFKAVSDKKSCNIYGVNDDGEKELLVQISGYDMEFAFNGKYLKTLNDVETAARGLQKFFREMMLSALLENRQ